MRIPNGDTEEAREFLLGNSWPINDVTAHLADAENVKNTLLLKARWQKGPPGLGEGSYGRWLYEIVYEMASPADKRDWNWTPEVSDEKFAADSHAASGVNEQPTHSADFRSVSWRGTTYTFTAQQAACVKILWDHSQTQTPDVSDAHLLEETETNSGLRHLFRNHPAWRTMIVSGATRGTHRLAGEK